MNDSTPETVRAGRILVVDDEKLMSDLTVSMLTAAGYDCRDAGSGLEALAFLESGEQFDLILSDFMMPDLDGIGLMERTKEEYSDIPVVIVTAVHDISVALSAIRHGVYDYLLKPCEREQLLDAVSRALESRRLKLEQRAYVSGLEAQIVTLKQQLSGRES